MSKKYLINNNIDSNLFNKESSYSDNLLDMSVFNEDIAKYIFYEFDKNSDFYKASSWFKEKDKIYLDTANWADDFMKLFEK